MKAEILQKGRADHRQGRSLQINSTRTAVYPNGRRVKTELSRAICTSDSRRFKDKKVEVNTKALEENTGDHTYDLRVRKNFLNMTGKGI